TILSNRDSFWHDTVLALGDAQNSTTGGGKGTLRCGQLNGFTLANGQIQLDKNWRDQLTYHGDSRGPSLLHLDHFVRYGWSIVGIHVQRPTNSYSIDEGVAANRGWIKRTISARGDFNGDGMSDIALVGGQGWGSVPIATSNGDGSFGIENHS